MLKKFLLLAPLIFMFFTTSQAQNDSVVRKIPAELLFKEIKQSNFKISPNGKLFLEVLEENFEAHIVIIDIDGYKLKNRIPMNVASIGEVTWLTNNRILFEKSGEIFAIDIDGNNQLKLVDRKAEKRVKNYYKNYLNYRFNSILSLNVGDNDEILVEAFDADGNAYVKKVNVFTGEKETLFDGKELKVNKWFANKNGQINLGVRMADDSWQYVRKSLNSQEWHPIELHIGGEFYPFKLEGESFLDKNVLFVDTDYDKEIIYLASNIDSDKRQLLSYNFKRRFVVDTIAKDVNCDIMDNEGSDLRLLFNKKERRLGAIRYEGILPEFNPLTESFASIDSKLKSKFSLVINDILDYDDAFQRFVIYQWSDTYAGNIGVYDAVTDQYYVMFHFNEELNGYQLAKTRNISIQTEDNYVLPAYLTLPRKYDNMDKVSLLVVPHGGPWVRDYWGLDPYSQFFASRDYAVLRVNYRGSTGFGKEHLQAGIEGIGSIMIDDIIAAVTEVIKKYKVNESSVFIYGHSYGGYATYMALAKHPELFKAGVAIAAPTDIKKMLKLQKKEGNDFSYDYWKYALGENSNKYYDQVSPINHVKNITSPLLVFHGKYDQIVPIDQAEEMEKEFNKLKKKNATFRTIQFLGHSLRDSNSHGYVLKEADEFFNSSLE